MLRHPRYTAGGSFYPQSTPTSALAGLTGIAAQFGVNVAQGDPSQSPLFYVDLLTSRPVLSAIVDSAYTFRRDRQLVTARLVDLLDVSGSSAGERRENTIRAVRQQITVAADPRTGVVRFSVRTKWPELSFQLANRLLDLVNQFNLASQQDQADAQRRFLEGRVESSRAELRTSEVALESFLQRNRTFQGDPQLSAEHDRIEREISLRQQVYLSLAQSLEQARVDAARNTPVIIRVETPELPVVADRRYGALKAAAGSLAAFLMLAAMILTRAHLRSDPETSADYLALRAAIARAVPRFARRQSVDRPSEV